MATGTEARARLETAMGVTASKLQASGTAEAHVELAARAATGDRDAERELCRRLFPAIRAFARRRLRGTQAEDFAQDALFAFVQALRSGRIDDPARAAGFALGICRHMASDHVRTQARRRELLERFGPSELPSDVVETSAWDQPTSFGADHLEDCLSHLTRRARDVIKATFYEEENDGAIAATMSLTEANVRVIRHRTIAALRDCLQRPVSWTVR